MTEVQTIDADGPPLTIASLTEQFAACGLSAGQTVLVHSSLSRLGWVAGGAVAVIQALLQVLTPAGTLMMPAHTAGNTDPANWINPPVPAEWWPSIRAYTPPYDPVRTPTRMMGAIPELFRTWPEVRRSAHPIVSFAAFGPNASFLLDHHELADMLGEKSPLARLYDLDGYVLLLGVGHGNNTSLHLAEARADYPGKKWLQEGCAMQVNGERHWVSFQTLEWDSEDFDLIGRAYEQEYTLPRYQVGQAVVRFLKQRPLVDFAVDWMAKNR
jgi:aminoglycoside 3-N-acetyltransferase